MQQQPAEQVDKLISRLEGSEEAKLVYWDERSQRLRALSPRRAAASNCWRVAYRHRK